MRFVYWVEDHFSMPVTLWVDFKYNHYLITRKGERVGYRFYWVDFTTFPRFENEADIPVIELPVRTEHWSMEEILHSFICGISQYYAWLTGTITDATEPDDEEAEAAAEEADALYRRLEALVEQISAEEKDAKDDTYVFRTLGKMRRTTDVNGAETIELEYTEDDSMENTRTVIAFTPSQNDRVSIIHDGPVMSSLVCERGVRHISVYKTPVMPFEVAVYAKRCDAALTFERGGYIELDYLVELRGMDIQRTCMTIDAICFN
jgi:uncharacterized beta-barrel protein YwiB (DUF1934 family)